MRPVYKAALKLSYALADLAQFVLDPIVNAIWNLSGNIECWAHQKLTKLEADTPMYIETPTGWVDLDRYHDAIAGFEAEMHEVMPERFKGLSAKQAYDLLKKEQG